MFNTTTVYIHIHNKSKTISKFHQCKLVQLSFLVSTADCGVLDEEVESPAAVAGATTTGGAGAAFGLELLDEDPDIMIPFSQSPLLS